MRALTVLFLVRIYQLTSSQHFLLLHTRLHAGNLRLSRLPLRWSRALRRRRLPSTLPASHCRTWTLVSSKVHSFHPPPSGPTVIVLLFSCVLIRLRTASPFKTNIQVTTLTLTSLLSPPRQPFSIEGHSIGEELKHPSKIPEEATSSLASPLLHASLLFYATHLLQRHFISIIHIHTASTHSIPLIQAMSVAVPHHLNIQLQNLCIFFFFLFIIASNPIS